MLRIMQRATRNKEQGFMARGVSTKRSIFRIPCPVSLRLKGAF